MASNDIRTFLKQFSAVKFYKYKGWSNSSLRQDAEEDLRQYLQKLSTSDDPLVKQRSTKLLGRFERMINAKHAEQYWNQQRRSQHKNVIEANIHSEHIAMSEKTTNAFISEIRNARTITLPRDQSPTTVYQDTIPDIFADDEKKEREVCTENESVAKGESEEESEDESVYEAGSSMWKEVEEVFRRMNDSQKWKLSTGKVVEDALFEYAIQCKFEHLSQSFIVDPDDTNGVFTEEELTEIEETDTKSLPDIPIDLMKYMNSFRKSSIKELRTQLSVVQDWEGANFSREYHFDHDWIKNSVHNLVQEYEGDNLVAGHSETHYLMHYWHIIDRCFLNLQDIHSVRGEASSFSSSHRKNKIRSVPGLMQVARKVMGRRGDLIIRKHHNEYENGEAGKEWEGENGTKILKERGLKALKMQKDMFVNLCNAVKWDVEKVRKLQVIGWIFSELNVLLLRLDSPRGYVCRVVRSPIYTIPQTFGLFGQQVVPFLALIWKAKAIVKEVVDIVESAEDRDDEDSQLQELQAVG
ncbi:hypothetical protein BC938DRAFT_473000, partial [Jimgerdemannia flammicorona]